MTDNRPLVTFETKHNDASLSVSSERLGRGLLVRVDDLERQTRQRLGELFLADEDGKLLASKAWCGDCRERTTTSCSVCALGALEEAWRKAKAFKERLEVARNLAAERSLKIEELERRIEEMESENTSTAGDLNVVPFFPFVAIESVEIAEKTKGGIVLTEETRKDQRRDFGRIIAKPDQDMVPQGERFEEIRLRIAKLEVGQVVAFPRQAGQKIEIGTDYDAVFVHAQDVLGEVDGLG